MTIEVLAKLLLAVYMAVSVIIVTFLAIFKVEDWIKHSLWHKLRLRVRGIRESKGGETDATIQRRT